MNNEITMQPKQIYQVIVHDNNNISDDNNNNNEDNEVHLNLLKCFNDTVETLNLSNCAPNVTFPNISRSDTGNSDDVLGNQNEKKDINNDCINDDSENRREREKNSLSRGKEEIKNFLISYEFWIFIVPILIMVIFVIMISVWFTLAYNSNSSNTDGNKQPAGSQIISYRRNETINKICLEPIDTGPCRADFLMFAFSKEQWRCVPFTYGGCHGNSNRFLTLEECEMTCY
ncbi:unnamed protein product [Heterobilharzia americana]|nr:unnamed protein product [Heterobilharzia americana]